MTFEKVILDHNCAINSILRFGIEWYTANAGLPGDSLIWHTLVENILKTSPSISSEYREFAERVLNSWNEENIVEFNRVIRLYKSSLTIKDSSWSDTLSAAKSIFLTLKCPYGMALVLDARGRWFYDHKVYDSAAVAFSAAKDISEQIADQNLACISTRNEAKALAGVGKFGASLTARDHALSLARNCDFGFYLIDDHSGLGTMFFRIGDYRLAATHFRMADSVAELWGQIDKRIYPLKHLALCQQKLGNQMIADSLYDILLDKIPALPPAQAAGEWAWAIVYRADTHIPLGDTIGLRQELQTADSIFSSLGERIGAGSAFLQKGRLDIKAEHYDSAIADLDRSLGKFIKPEYRLYPAKELGQAFLMSNELDSALSYYTIAEECYENTRKNLPRSVVRRKYLTDKLDIASGLVTTHVRMGNIDLAFNVAERFRARTYLDALGEKDLSADNSESKRIQGEISAILRSRRLCEPTDCSAQDIETQIDAALIDLADSRLLWTAAHPEKAANETAEYRQFIKDNSPLTARLYYFATESSIWVWFADADSSGLYEVPQDNSAVRAEIESVLRIMSTRQAGKNTLESLRRQLSGLAQLLPPFIRNTRGNLRQLEIYPSDYLVRFPFETILVDSLPLIQKFAVSYFPSFTLKNKLPKFDFERDDTMVVGLFGGNFADGIDCSSPSYPLIYSGIYQNFPSLTGVDTIGAALARKAGMRCKDYLNQIGQEKVILADTLNPFDVLHFATHGVANEQSPDLSGLVLPLDRQGGQDGILLSGEISSLDLRARPLVILSACRSGDGEFVVGEGLDNLTKSFFIGGASSVIATFWPIEDLVTATVFNEFYDSLLAGIPPAVALQTAKCSIIDADGGLFSNPYYWAPFVIFGD